MLPARQAIRCTFELPSKAFFTSDLHSSIRLVSSRLAFKRSICGSPTPQPSSGTSPFSTAASLFRINATKQRPRNPPTTSEWITARIGIRHLTKGRKPTNYLLSGTEPSPHTVILERSLVPHKNELLLRCTEFDAKGNVKVASGEFRKSELCTKHGLLPRDLRKVDTGHTIVPLILVRKNSILINLLHIRALIKADTVLLFDVIGSTDSHTQSVFMYDLEGKLRQGSKAMGGLPYELRAFEAILISVTSALESEMQVLRKMVNNLLVELEEGIDRDKLRQLLVYSKKLSTFEQKATLVRDALDEMLEQDEDLAGMYLSEKLQKGSDRPADQHDEVEMLLESYLKQTDEIVQTVENLSSNIRNTEEIVNIILDANRNSLMLLELKVSMLTLGIGSGALIAGLLGMNLKNFMEDSNAAFATVSMLAVSLSLLISATGLYRLRKTQRLTMWAEDNALGKKGGRADFTLGISSQRGERAFYPFKIPKNHLKYRRSFENAIITNPNA
ncbi:hypothetical protein G7K_1997-t1 [Saitoella complicata NRRL Y-17804]|uniref:Magnesium transporter n=1 Tax=Saitoella complicata (strain BCRC 22490 / CBS 7301 / JCM 7358 / NBRC 10748 / NRRL Y-17804) TaxID=698492 RepID=A0A0E9ND80_SAICN|nr:hypothetical protein G7K_1997-t1 [Saitoella complicata NRRL Y-17804]